MAVVLTAAEFSLSSPVVEELLMANAYAIGIVLVVLGRSELFTEHTTLAVLPVLDRRASVGQLARLWGLIYAGNVLGAAAFAGIIVLVAPALGIVGPKAFVWMIAASIGLLYLPHSIVGPVEVLAGVLMTAELTPVDFLRFLATATIGNAIGGVVFVSLLKYGQVVLGGPPPERAADDPGSGSGSHRARSNRRCGERVADEFNIKL